MVKKRKRKLHRKRIDLAIEGYATLIILVGAIPLWVWPIVIGESHGFFEFFLLLDFFSLFTLWRNREMFFSSVEIQKDGILEKCLGKKTVLVPWEEIESASLRYVALGPTERVPFITVRRTESESYKRSMQSITNGFDYQFALDEDNIDLLTEYLPQRLKDMLGPNAFDYWILA